MTTPEETTLNEKIRLNYLARKLEELSSPREITIASIRYQEENDQLKAAAAIAESVYIEKISDLMDENQALKEKLNAIQTINI